MGYISSCFVYFLVCCFSFICWLILSKPMSDDKAPQIKYDVFVSFRGKEIRKGFLSHLTEAFAMKKIHAFVDDKLEKGEEIWPSLVAAIERSAISLIIFSPDYASSPWCLREVVKIIECEEKYGRTVIPVFYNIEPTYVKHQSGSYEKAFTEHARKYETEVQLWRCALDKSARLSGVESSNIQNDAVLVNVIVADVLEKLKRLHKPQVYSKGLIGIDKKIATLEAWISNESKDTCLIGIWGMGGIGKTTLAEVVFNRLRYEYEGSYFLANERDQSNKHGTTPLKKIIFSKLLGEEVDFDTPNSLPENIVRRIGCMKVLIVLDDVNDSAHIEKLLGSVDNFGMGSKVIVTTRDEQVLRINKANKTYKLKEFSSDEALELFNLNAYRERDQEKEYNEISKLVVNYAKGNPLVVKVLAHLLHGRNKEEWESLLSKLKKMPPKEVYDVMKLSYDSLDRKGQQIFLDLACFFLRLDEQVKVGDLKSLLKDNESDNSVAFELRRLEEKALITVSEDNIVSMHDSLQEMAWEIVRQESIDDPGRRSRLWDPNDIYEALENDKLGDVIRSIRIVLRSTKNRNLSHSQIFAMRRLKFVKICETYRDGSNRLILSDRTKFKATELKFLCWDNYSIQSLPKDFNAEKLVILRMKLGKMEKLWDGVLNLVNLKKLDLEGCSLLKELPDLSRATRLEELYLFSCWSLTSVHPSIFALPKLERLDLSYCQSLSKPASNSRLLSLRYLDLEGFKDFSSSLLGPMHVREANFVRAEFETLLSSFGDLPKLESLNLGDNSMRSLPELPPFLLTLDVQDCHSLKTLPELPRSLKTLNVDCCSSLQSIVELPRSLETLNAFGCDLLETLPELPPNLKTLRVTSCHSLETLPMLPALLQTLDVSYCSSLQSLPNLPPSLETLDARHCISLRSVLFPSIAVEQLKENRKTVLFLGSEKLDEHSKTAIGLNAKINMMKFANQLLSAPNRNRVKNDRQYDQCVYTYPGSSVPEWLEYNTTKDCLIIDLSSAPPSPNLGFIFCFILDMSLIKYKYLITIFDVNDGGKSESCRLCKDYGVGVDHLMCVMIYNQRCSEFLNSRAKNQAKIKIQVTTNDHVKGFTAVEDGLKGFGVSPISTSTYNTFIQQIELRD